MNRRAAQPLVALLLGVLIIAGLTVYSASTPTDAANPSSRSAGKLGALALYTWLGKLGLPVTRISGGFDIGASDLLVEYDPSVDFAPGDLDRITAFVRGGGDVLLAFGPESVALVQPLLVRLNVQLAIPEAAGVAVPAQPFDVAGRVRHVPVAAGLSLADQPPLVPLLRQNNDIVFGAVQLSGAGRVYLSGNTGPFSNDGLRRQDAGSLVLSVLERARGGRVAFDEYHHGEGTSDAGAGAIFSGAMGAAAILAGLVALLYLAVNGRRLGRPVAAGDEVAVPSATSYVSAMGHLLARSRRRGAVAARYADELKRAVSGATGIDAHLDDGAFVAALEQSGADAAGAVRALLQRARVLAAGRPDEAALLRLARDVDSLEAGLSHTEGVPAQLRR